LDAQPASDGDPGATRPEPPELKRAAVDLGHTGVELGRSAWKVLGGFRALLAADLSLSRSAFGLTLAYTGVAIALGASAWLLLMTLIVLGLQSTGWVGWFGAVLVPALLSGAGAAWCAWRATKVFEDTTLAATRRQLARLDLGEDPEEVERHPERVP
jgi:uncharacterized membrane protein YqjE